MTFSFGGVCVLLGCFVFLLIGLRWIAVVTSSSLSSRVAFLQGLLPGSPSCLIILAHNLHLIVLAKIKVFLPSLPCAPTRTYTTFRLSD